VSNKKNRAMTKITKDLETVLISKLKGGLFIPPDQVLLKPIEPSSDKDQVNVSDILVSDKGILIRAEISIDWASLRGLLAIDLTPTPK